MNSSSDQQAGTLSGTDGVAVGAVLAEQRQTIAQRLLDAHRNGGGLLRTLDHQRGEAQVVRGHHFFDHPAFNARGFGDQHVNLVLP